MSKRRRRRVPDFSSNLTDLSVAANEQARFQRLSQRPVVKEIELAAYRHAMRKPGHLQRQR